MQDIDLLDTVNVSDVMAEVDEAATLTMTVDEVLELFDRHHHHGLPVIEATIVLLAIFMVLSIIGIGESAKVAVIIMTTETIKADIILF